MEQIHCEIRFKEDETRQSPGRLTGTLLPYETRASDRPELFKTGALEWPENGILFREMHQRNRPVVRAIPYVDGNEVKIDTPLPDTTIGRDTAVNFREGILTGLSVEFKSLAEGVRGGMREIRRALLLGGGLVDDPSYADSLAEVRSRAQHQRPNGGYAVAVTLTHSQLSAALRLGDSGLENAEANRLLAYATEAVNKYAANRAHGDGE